jgi:RNA recognition motif-containing protein
MSIYVGNLSYSVTEDDLTKVFSDYGAVKRVQLPIDRESGRPRGFGFVEMESDTAELNAIEALNGAEWMGRVMKVNKARPREEKNDRSSGGSWNKSAAGGYSRRYS